MATHSSILAWKIPWTEEPGGLQFIGSQRVRLDGGNLACTQENPRKCLQKRKPQLRKVKCLWG